MTDAPARQFTPFDLERGQSIWEHRVAINLSESGVHPVTLRDLAALGLDTESLLDVPLQYIQTNGSVALREGVAALYPGATADHIEITNGTSEANCVLAQLLLGPGDELVMQTPNYLQMSGMAANLGATVKSAPLRFDAGWEPDWDAFETALSPRTKMIYVCNPNNPTGHVLSSAAMTRIVAAAESVGAWLVADEVYRGLEWQGSETPSFWGMSDRVIVTSGLSKAWGIPGARIGWLVAPPTIADACWARHDYTTIAPGALNDRIAQFAVRPDIRAQLLERSRSYLGTNRDVFNHWLAAFDGFLRMHPPQAGGYAFVRYNADVPSIELGDRIRAEQSVLVVPGAWTGMEHFLRIGLGGPPEPFAEGLRRIGVVLEALRA